VWVRPEEQRVVGECLAAARQRAGVTQRELAARLGKPQSFISAYESGQRRVDLLEFLAIVAGLRADPLAVFAEILTRRSPAEI
jgi:transcriptional regulator with XRE-family HTH domain